MDFLDLEGMLSNLVSIGGQLLLLIIVYVIVAPIGRKAISKAMGHVAKRQKLNEGRKKTLENLLLNVFTYVLLFFFIVTFLGILGIPLAPVLAGAGIVGLAVGFGAQGLVSDIVTGFFILIEKQIDVDDYVTAGGHDGIVEELGLRTTQLRGFDGTLHFIPNRYIQAVNNHTRGNMRALVDMGIGYSENIDQAMEILQNVCDRFREDDRIKEGPDVVGVQSLGSSDVVLRVIAQTEKMLQWEVERDLRKAMKEALDDAGIEIPFPHRTIVQKETE
ncbi:mechanosensitive ion channel family protein [Alkalibacillus salilacus]|uniref:Small conductance mechanosensitive channel n=1 Tax=Alkalibacillus salilacus TaxID=284582 RepID=A0ABT9VGK0_9BACI|nr:mechanosensitive ion channel family protein [Alkalibacillus salilacus]MDQ0160081.1 small conductance mechanosensitive channel [Alkalibacillus salilacus]